VLPPSPQEIFEKRVTLVRHGYPEWLGYSILSVYRYWESALERDSSDPDEQFLGYRMSGSNSPETTLLRSRQTVEVTVKSLPDVTY
jgi:hypothetical protein